MTTLITPCTMKLWSTSKISDFLLLKIDISSTANTWGLQGGKWRDGNYVLEIWVQVCKPNELLRPQYSIKCKLYLVLEFGSSSYNSTLSNLNTSLWHTSHTYRQTHTTHTCTGGEGGRKRERNGNAFWFKCLRPHLVFPYIRASQTSQAVTIRIENFPNLLCFPYLITISNQRASFY